MLWRVSSAFKFVLKSLVASVGVRLLADVATTLNLPVPPPKVSCRTQYEYTSFERRSILGLYRSISSPDLLLILKKFPTSAMASSFPLGRCFFRPLKLATPPFRMRPFPQSIKADGLACRRFNWGIHDQFFLFLGPFSTSLNLSVYSRHWHCSLGPPGFCLLHIGVEGHISLGRPPPSMSFFHSFCQRRLRFTEFFLSVGLS